MHISFVLTGNIVQKIDKKPQLHQCHVVEGRPLHRAAAHAVQRRLRGDDVRLLAQLVPEHHRVAQLDLARRLLGQEVEKLERLALARLPAHAPTPHGRAPQKEKSVDSTHGRRGLSSSRRRRRGWVPPSPPHAARTLPPRRLVRPPRRPSLGPRRLLLLLSASLHRPAPAWTIWARGGPRPSRQPARAPTNTVI